MEIIQVLGIGNKNVDGSPIKTAVEKKDNEIATVATEPEKILPGTDRHNMFMC